MKIIFGLLFVLTGILVQAQPSFQRKVYTHGSIIDDSTGQKIAFAQLYNESRRIGYITDSAGNFRIPALKGDTIVVSALGYLGKVIIIDGSYYRTGVSIELSPQAFEIGEVSIITFSDYEDFKKQFLALQLPHTKTDILRENLATLARQAGREGAYEKAVSDALSRSNKDFASVSIPIPSRYDIQMQHYNEVLKKEERQRVIDKKYNRDIIFRVTRLPEDEITQFIGFCNFSEQYLYSATPYEILVSIEEKFKKYKLMKESGKSYFPMQKLIDELLG
jgi:hypothetical protein